MALSERRRQARTPRTTISSIKLAVPRPEGGSAEVNARLINVSEDGLGVETEAALRVGATVRVSAPGGINGRIGAHKAHVRWSERSQGGTFVSGLQFDDGARQKETRKSTSEDDAAVDHYEVLQLSPKADSDTIHRVFRVLAQRFHPDNRETGNEENFKRVLTAYEVLSDPVKRASFDARRIETNRTRWRIFSQPETAVGVEAERRKRHGVLSLLYTRRLTDARNPSMSLHEFEDMLDCPREHLEFSLWYLRENGLITKLDNGRYGITVKGVDEAEESGLWKPSKAKMLPAAGERVTAL